MNTYYQILQEPTKKTLEKHAIKCFDFIVQSYPEDYSKIITYISQCYSYVSEYIVEEKDWDIFLLERFKANKIPDAFKMDIVYLQSSDIADCIDEYLDLQKQPLFQSLIAKQGLRQQMLKAMTSHENDIKEKLAANELVNSLDEQINLLYEELKQGQKVFGNHKGVDAVRKARSVNKLNIGNFVK